MSVAKGFISFEGIEGSGKSTQTRLLADHLKAGGYNVLRTHEPGGTNLGLKIRELLLDPNGQIDPLTELLLYYADRAQHIREVIRPALLEGTVIITDRFADSTVAYQGYARGLDMSIIAELNRIVVQDTSPFLTILLDLDVEEGLRRNRRAEKEDRFELEAVEFHRRVREGFFRIAEKEPDRFRIVDASRSQEEISREVIEIVDAEFNKLNIKTEGGRLKTEG